MTVISLFELLFGVGVVLAGGTLASAATGGRRAVAVGAVLALGALAGAAWITFAFDSREELALSAGGLTVCLAAAAVALPFRRAVARNRRVDEELERAQQDLRRLVASETAGQAAELERLLARGRADSVSRLNEEERRLGEERRHLVAEREQAVSAELAEALAAVQRRVENRLAGWAEDLERAQHNLTTELARMGERQRQLIAEAEARILTDLERLEAESANERASITKLRDDLGRAAQEIVSETNAELEQHATDRRRALHELGERLRRRERELTERIEREETEATERIQAGFADVERRAVEALERSADRASSRYSEEAAQQFAGAIKAAREDAARRLSRELDRAVEAFAREASTVLAERLAQVGDAGAQRVDKRMGGIAAGLERQRDELAAALEQRLADYENELRRRLQTLVADVDSERAVLEARLRELGRRMDEALAQSYGGLAAPGSRER